MLRETAERKLLLERACCSSVHSLECFCARTTARPENVAPQGSGCSKGRYQLAGAVPFLGQEAASVPALTRTSSSLLCAAQNNFCPFIVIQSSSLAVGLISSVTPSNPLPLPVPQLSYLQNGDEDDGDDNNCAEDLLSRYLPSA